MPKLDLIVGLPMETSEDQNETLNLAQYVVKKGGFIRAHYFMPLPGTPLEMAEPKPVDENVAREIGRLAQDGKATGKWTPRM